MPYDLPSADEPTSPRSSLAWVVCGGSLLAGTAGYVNVVMLGFFAVPVSHMTGAVSRLAIDIGTAEMLDFLPIGLILMGFVVGAITSGVIIGNATLRPGRRYGVALLLEGLLLALATVFAIREGMAAIPLAAIALGLQNAMASSYRGLILRTTHVTGVVTDIGVLLGYRLRGRYIKTWKLCLLMAIFTAFLAGGVLGMFALQWLGMAALGVGAAGCLVAGSLYLIAQWIKVLQARG
jgi:uncharacterized membrane protein YoaK (UPF0700 family)